MAIEIIDSHQNHREMQHCPLPLADISSGTNEEILLLQSKCFPLYAE